MFYIAWKWTNSQQGVPEVRHKMRISVFLNFSPFCPFSPIFYLFLNNKSTSFWVEKSEILALSGKWIKIRKYLRVLNRNLCYFFFWKYKNSKMVLQKRQLAAGKCLTSRPLSRATALYILKIMPSFFLKKALICRLYRAFFKSYQLLY